jgi:hypothetical protein
MVKLLFARDVARQRGVSLSTARAWLATLERTHGAKVVIRVRNRLCTTEEALATVFPGSTTRDEVLLRRLHPLDVRIARVAVWMRELQRAFERLQRRAAGM